MNELLKRFKVICKKCGKEANLKLDDDSGCNDPECCGGRSYWIEAKCECGEIETTDSFR